MRKIDFIVTVSLSSPVRNQITVIKYSHRSSRFCTKTIVVVICRMRTANRGEGDERPENSVATAEGSISETAKVAGTTHRPTDPKEDNESEDQSSFHQLKERMRSLCSEHGWTIAANDRTTRKSPRKFAIRNGDLHFEFNMTDDAAKTIILSTVVHNTVTSFPPPPPRTVSPEVNPSRRKTPLGSRAMSRDSSPLRPRKRPSYSLMTKMMKIKAILSERHEEVQISVFDSKFILFHSIPVSMLRQCEFPSTIQNFMLLSFEIQGEFQ